ncbi:sulfurtransferase TusA family protein [Aliiroseovarius crassostreae]|uniref:sulfurtransferase TusA family protein n=1 Tax=Aliiroseovarius crassostreae TaxID=154981 RepID=UPI0035CCFDE1
MLDRLCLAFYVSPMTYDETLDAIGLLCPLPVLKARKRLKSMQNGQVLRLEATDPAAVIDVPHFCAEQGHEFLGEAPAKLGDQDVTHYFIRKG